MSKEKPLAIIAGPTGSGKSALALELCRLVGGEIISADAMQIYRGCDIVTAKVTPVERGDIPHYLLDVANPDETWSAARWADAARATIAEIASRGQVPVLCGGTGFYLRALLEPSSVAGVPPDPRERARWQQLADSRGREWVHGRLAQVDPAAAERLHPHDLVRVIRALEIAANKVAPEPPPGPARDYVAWGLEVPRARLYEQLNQRVDAMLAAGAVEETRRLVGQYGRDAPALRGLGYRHLIPVLKDSSLLSAAVEVWKRDTRRYAKRQLTWFRHQLRMEWLPVAGGMQAVAQHLAATFFQEANRDDF